MKIPREKTQRELVNITPLIDVVFILLVFFMLAGAIERPDPVPVDLARSTSLDFSDAEDDRDLIVTVDAGGALYIEEERLSDAALTRRVADTLAWTPDVLIHVKADGETDAVRVIEILELMREAGALYVVLITAGGGEAFGEEAP